MFKLTKDSKWRSFNFASKSKNCEEKEEAALSNARKEENLETTKGKREYMISKIAIEEMEQHVHKLYIQTWIMLMTLSMETPYHACISIEGVNGG